MQTVNAYFTCSKVNCSFISSQCGAVEANSFDSNELDTGRPHSERRCFRYVFATVGLIGMKSSNGLQLDGIWVCWAAMVSWCSCLSPLSLSRSNPNTDTIGCCWMCCVVRVLQVYYRWAKCDAFTSTKRQWVKDSFASIVYFIYGTIFVGCAKRLVLRVALNVGIRGYLCAVLWHAASASKSFPMFGPNPTDNLKPMVNW